MRSRLAWLIAAALAVAVAVPYVVHLQGGGDAGRMPDVKLAPSALYTASFPDLEGKPRALGEWQGRIMVLNFWATWCPPCRDEIPAFIRVQNDYRDRGVTFVGLAADRPEPVARYAQEVGINYTILVSEDQTVGLAERAGNPQGALPYTAIVDREGRIVRNRLGPYTESQLRQVLDQVLKESPARGK
jgi:thiol-disulfide isomerase/thioredoxin